MSDLLCALRPLSPRLCLAAGLAVLAGCTLPDQMQVSRGLHPSNQDKDVVFRTTYYFRAFDYCADKASTGQPSIDSVYRFRLTGKSKPLNQVHFESGTLTASEIDPFGASVAFDPETRQHYFKSKRDVRADAAREAAYQDLERTFELYQGLKEVGLEGDADVTQNLNDLVAHQIEIIKGPTLPAPQEDTQEATVDKPEQPAEAQAQFSGAALRTTAAADANENDPDNSKNGDDHAEILADFCMNPQRGFQILGPQGWETFDQEDRLVFALTTSGEPLLSTLQELSGRVLDARAPSTGDLLLPLVEEEFRTKEATRLLSDAPAGDAEKGAEALSAALLALNGESEKNGEDGE